MMHTLVLQTYMITFVPFKTVNLKKKHYLEKNHVSTSSLIIVCNTFCSLYHYNSLSILTVRKYFFIRGNNVKNKKHGHLKAMVI